MPIKRSKLLIIRLWNHNLQIFKAILFLISAVILISLFPREGSISIDYEQGKPWRHKDLIAPFDFSINKSEDELNQEKSLLMKDIKFYYKLDSNIYIKEKNEFYRDLNNKCRDFNINEDVKHKYQLFGLKIIDTLFSRGIIRPSSEFNQSHPDHDVIYLLKKNIAEEKKYTDFFTIHSAENYIKSELNKHKEISKDFLQPLLLDALNQNVTIDDKTGDKIKQTAYDNISLTKGIVQAGEIIISQGDIVTADKKLILDSYIQQYKNHTHSGSYSWLILTGQSLLVCISLILLALFLAYYRKDIFAVNKKLLLILLLIILMVFTTSMVIKYNVKNLYIVPICLVPIIVRSFFDTRLAQFVHIIMIILIGFLTPNSFEFVFLQLVAGVIAIITIIKLYQRAQFFFTALIIFITYAATYTGLILMKGGNLEDIELDNYMRFAFSALLTLFSYPLIFLFEKIFSFVTDVSLMELSDTNSKLLRELAQRAPGTFQHSLRLSNLAEEIIYQINGKALLVKTGAMYHDIGKMESPMYFTENQLSGMNPHDDLTYEESAKIIINHVIRGVELAKKNNIPEEIIDFIRTHHGTTKTQYFLVMHNRDREAEFIDESLFTYHGPIPFSKETAVLMLVDGVEAAARSLKTYDEKSISDIVEKIVNDKIAEEQLINANITLKEITIVKKTLKKQLRNLYHVRTAYPS